MDPFYPEWTRCLYKSFFQSIMFELREVIGDETSFKDDPNYIVVVFDLVMYALGSQNFQQLVKSKAIMESLMLFQKYAKIHPVKFHQVATLVINKLGTQVPLNNMIVLLDSDKYALLLRQLKLILSFLFDHYRNNMDVKNKKSLLLTVMFFFDVLKKYYAVAQNSENPLTNEVPKIFHELCDEFITKSVVYDLMENFELNLSLVDLYKEAIEVRLKTSFPSILNKFSIISLKVIFICFHSKWRSLLKPHQIPH